MVAHIWLFGPLIPVTFSLLYNRAQARTDGLQEL
jgi:hypothetical protein